MPATRENDFPSWRKLCLRFSAAFAIPFLAVIVGCNSNATVFNENLLAVFRAEQENSVELDKARPLVQRILEAEFGLPDQPRLPNALNTPAYEQLIDMKAVARSAGPVFRGEDRVEYGLYRKHCSVCHGITGDGYGASAALLSPYPRDFRRGTFKFGTQGQGTPPSHADLARVISEGIPGTAMPAMRTLESDKYFAEDCETLAYYVQFLAMRGEVERILWLEIIPEMESSQLEALNDDTQGMPLSDSLRLEIDQAITRVADRWKKVIDKPIQTPTHKLAYKWPDDLATANRNEMIQSAKRGSELFRSDVTACIQCHGDKGKGDGRLVDFDEWTKDWTIRIGIDPRDKTAWKPLKKLGLLKPVADSPRNFHQGVFRGGNDPGQIFLRVSQGIDGTPMPAVPKKDTSPVGLTEEQIWDLVNYCQALSHVAKELE